MASVHDVAAYILERRESMSSMKLQKLVYYSQAWHLVWDDEPLFADRITAWANGPVVYELFDLHRGKFSVSAPWPAGDSSQLSQSERETIDIVLRNYGDLSGRQLSALTHSEGPWRSARQGLSDTARSSEEITQSSMAAFYGALAVSEEAEPVSDIQWDEWEERF
jgi:uncharacterized phage-associated protein